VVLDFADPAKASNVNRQDDLAQAGAPREARPSTRKRPPPAADAGSGAATTPSVADVGHGAGAGGLSEKLDPEGAADFKAAEAELRDRFQITDPNAAKGQAGPAAPNAVSQEEFEKIAHTFSDIRLGRSDIKFGKQADDDYKHGAMDDIGRLMQTDAGRQLVFQMANNTAGEVDKDGNPVHHTTTLKPYLKSHGGGIDPSNSDESAATSAAQKDEKNGQGVDSVVRYNPGVTVDPQANDPQTPWWPARSDVILMHEMTHAYYDTQGHTDFGHVDKKTGDGVEGNVGAYKGTLQRYEHQAAGLGHYAGAPISENKYRDERARMGALATTGMVPGDVNMAHRDYY
jgi:hypothetical protein